MQILIVSSALKFISMVSALLYKTYFYFLNMILLSPSLIGLNNFKTGRIDYSTDKDRNGLW
jgi:hypothetical protein